MSNLKDLLASLDVSIASVCLGYREGEGAGAHFEWIVTLTRGEATYRTTYRMGAASVKPMPRSFRSQDSDRQRDRAWLRDPRSPLPPTVDCIVASLASDASSGQEMFADFCGSHGYEIDSRKALDTYLACQDAAIAMRRLFREHYDAVCEADTDVDPSENGTRP